ncbi:acyl-CoA dehydrogenase family protein [Gammaproteobacteria bacterium]|nr:acyl-CoA dehydrogenase family protein [Gammaproteobacteria bacterium]
MVKQIETTDSFRKFVTEHWPSGEAQWFRNLAGSGWVGADWPSEYGGTGWTRQEQLHFITTLSEFRCPLMPDSVNVIAPMLLAYGSTEQKQYFLPRIQESPKAYTFQTQLHAGPGCILDHSTASLFLVSDGGSTTRFGTAGAATAILADSYSPLWLLYEKLLGLTHIQEMRHYWEEETSTELAQLEIETSSLIAFFLKKTVKNDRQIGISVNRDRYDLHASLFKSLGYYALLAPDSILASNEPLPFLAERDYLEALRKQIARDNTIQQDQLYKEHVHHEDT